MVQGTTIRTILVVDVINGWPLRRVNVNNAFLIGALIEEIYMDQTPSFET